MAASRKKRDQITDDVYRQFVHSLFSNGHVLIIGGFCYFVLAMMVYVRTSEVAFMLVAPLLLVVNIWRYLGIQSFHKRGSTQTVEEARYWERDYIIRGCAQGLAVGVFCILSIYVYHDPFAEVVSASVALGSLVTVASRNYGSRRMVVMLTLGFVAPATLAFLLRGELEYVIAGLVFVPMGFITVTSAGYVRRVLFTAIDGHKRADQLALRFDRALNTMPQGLLMFDTQGKVLVANDEATRMLAMGKSGRMLGRSVDSILRRTVAGGLLETGQSEFVTKQLLRALREGSDRKLILELLDGRYFELTIREGDNNLGVVMFEDVTARQRAAERITNMARFDSLTELPNRAYSQELIAKLLSEGDQGRNCGLAIFDLDDFKALNDTQGHTTGDRLLKALGRRLREHSSDSMLIGRLGGDEFIVFCDKVQDQSDFRRILDRVLELISDPIEASRSPVSIKASGGAVLMPAVDSDVDKLIIRADLALHTAKNQSRSGWLLFEDSMEQSFRTREMLKADLRVAIKDRSLRVVYQPIIDLDTMKIESCEALCRWHHPELGQISPAVFIPLAEETGMICDITTFVLEEACSDCLNWPGQIGVSVNLSAKDLSDSSIVQKIAGVLEKTGLPAARLEVEMTETSLLDEKSDAHAYVEGIRQLGVHAALDDFGTGYSSLSYLHKLPFDKIKIDRSFILDMEGNVRAQQLVASIVQLSHQMGMTVTVEGVETFDQLKLLSSVARPDLVQGFLFGSALTASGIETMSHTIWPFAVDLKAATQARRSKQADREKGIKVNAG